MKKILAVFITAALCISCLAFTVSAAETAYEDVAPSDWYYADVAAISARGVMDGRSPTVFAPKAVMTRAEFVTMLTRIAAVSDEELAKCGAAADRFTDVAADDWCAPYIGWAAESSIVNGYTDGSFLPNAPLSRQELAVMLVRLCDLVGYVSDSAAPLIEKFADASDIAKWARPQLEQLRLAGFIGGDENGFYNPAKYASRAECAAVAVRLCTALDSFFTSFAPTELSLTLSLGKADDGGEVEAAGQSQLDAVISSCVPRLDSYTAVEFADSAALLERINGSSVESLEVTLVFTRYRTSCTGSYTLNILRDGGEAE